MNGAPRRNEVRLIGGSWKRSKLPVGRAAGLRPTPDRVRVTLFNWLGQDLSGWRCLDAFAGSGALGFEAGSRGAQSVVLIERDPVLAASLEASRRRLNATALRIETADALTWMARAADASFELIFLDPPYGSALLEPAVTQAARLLAPGGFVYVESGERWSSDQRSEHELTLFRQGQAGAVHFHLLQRSNHAGPTRGG